ncbi:hypothetical protein PPGU19_065820 (plasmid) [Paraburkholderia sp. PGU19]|uniref:hypothetical protein n=1 Tax=Paraburkholderia sp. PGU19 TaxID=2735434 RepID=UPI0015DCE925|nr:hypothetical protein [Paraburkholderia sp. PGU19]BCG02014.1 hypothetical protein PPGU19_065820 [Paraburkholderia sp. PGU19]
MELAAADPESVEGVVTAAPPAPATDARGQGVLRPWLRAQSINVTRHAAALRPFKAGEFGMQASAPSDGHVQAVNSLIAKLREGLLQMTDGADGAVRAAIESPNTARLQHAMMRKARAHDWVRGIEKIWDFYFELFGQRQSRYGVWLLGCDRIAMDCYQVAFTGIGIAKSIPAPPPFCYMRTGFAPATWGRGIRMPKLGRQLNPFPLIQLPYHRLVNPWTLAAVLHEVSHNLQSDLGLSAGIPKAMASRLLSAGMGDEVAMIWTRWNREMFSDVCAALLGGPGMVSSIMDVVGREPRLVYAFNPAGVHPPPYLRILISVEVLRRMGFADEAEQYRRAWTRIYPNPRSGGLPRPLLDTFSQAVRLAVDTMAWRPYAALGRRSLAQVFRFAPKEQRIIEEAARRLAAGNDPGIVPERFLIGAARFALDRGLARPGVIAENFYKELARR